MCFCNCAFDLYRVLGCLFVSGTSGSTFLKLFCASIAAELLVIPFLTYAVAKFFAVLCFSGKLL